MRSGADMSCRSCPKLSVRDRTLWKSLRYLVHALPPLSPGADFLLKNYNTHSVLRLTHAPRRLQRLSLDLTGALRQVRTAALRFLARNMLTVCDLYTDEAVQEQALLSRAAGRHGFTGDKASTLPLTPGQHAFEIDYSQERLRMSSAAQKALSMPCASPNQLHMAAA